MPSADPHSEPVGTPARRAALKMLDAVLRRDETLEQAERHAARGLAPSDAGLARAIAGEVLRRLPLLDELIDGVMRQPLPDDAKARMALRMALAQRIALDTPEHAAISTVLPLVDGGPRRLVHGVLSTLFKQGLPEAHEARLPDEVAERWGDMWGDDVVEAATQQLAARAPLDLSFSQVVPDDFPGQSLLPLHRRIEDAGDVTALPGFAEGGWWVQDLSASLPARLIPAGARRVLDACAAPGGKTMQLAAAGHEVVALDRSESRLKRLRENLQRTNLSAQVVAGRLEDHRADMPYDAILIDAPCSASGTFRRHPEILFRARRRVIEDMAAVQSRLLDAAVPLLAPGGSLVYATCSLEPEEGEEQVAGFLDRHRDFRVEPAPELGEFAPADAGWWRILPTHLRNVGGCDGFFAVHLVKQG